MKGEIYILETWEDDDGIVKFGKTEVFPSKKKAVERAYTLAESFIRTDERCADYELEMPTMSRFEEILDSDGYFLVSVYDGSPDYRRYYRIVKLETETEAA